MQGMNRPEKISKISKICVYCGSGAGTDPAYVEAAAEFGAAMAKAGIGLGYGGGGDGMMGGAGPPAPPPNPGPAANMPCAARRS